MTDSPQKRILSEISHQDDMTSENEYKNPQNYRFQRVNQVFKFSPTHSRQINVPEVSYENSSRSKYKLNTNCLEQLNSIFKLRKITGRKPFFEDGLQQQYRGSRSKSKINEDIQHSIVYIENLRKKRNFTESNHQIKTTFPKINGNQKQTVIEAIGLDLPQLKTKRDYHSRFVTQPTITQSNKRISKKKKQQSGLYSYLQRDFIDKKVQTLTQTKLVNYAKNPNDRNFHRVMLEKSRKFLKHSVQNNYRQVGKINSILNQESKKIIQQQLQQKKKKYERDYFVRNNVPYFSFLTLKQKQKESVLKSMKRKKSIS